MRTAHRLWLAILLLAIIAPASAQGPDFVMRPAAKFTDDDAVPQIIGGSKADPAEWPATLVFQNQAGGRCTSTAIGPRVILTAAHCIKDKAKGVVDINGTEISTMCHHHPEYHTSVTGDDPEWEKKVSPDFALCILSAELNVKNYENVNHSNGLPSLGSTIRLVGFGCNKAGGSDGGFGVLYEGDSAVTKIPDQSSYYTTTLGGAAVCFGDSGGGAYLYLNSARTRRILIGVNSRGNISTSSLLSTTGVPRFVSWATSLATQNGVEICGLHEDVKGCRPR